MDDRGLLFAVVLRDQVQTGSSIKFVD